MINPNKFALVANNLCPRIRKQQTKKGNTNNTQVKQKEQERKKIPGNNDQVLNSFDLSLSICSLQHKQSSCLKTGCIKGKTLT